MINFTPALNQQLRHTIRVKVSKFPGKSYEFHIERWTF